MKSGLSFLGAMFIVFLVWITIGKNHGERIERACSPFSWAGNVTVSLFSLTGGKAADRAQDMFDRVTYGCEYASWRLFFESRYLDVIKSYFRATGVAELSEHDLQKIEKALEYENIPLPPITVDERKALREKLKEEGYGKTYNFSRDEREDWTGRK